MTTAKIVLTSFLNVEDDGGISAGHARELLGGIFGADPVLGVGVFKVAAGISVSEGHPPFLVGLVGLTATGQEVFLREMIIFSVWYYKTDEKSRKSYKTDKIQPIARPK